ncbi:MAG: hypothetical protein J6Y08_02670 [Clostridiales bacterium]|nr:hypothetical protein [Clostridiales bacterium]
MSDMNQNNQTPVLSPQTLSELNTPASVSFEPKPEEVVVKDRTLLKNILVIVVAVLLIAGIVFTVFFFVNREDEKNRASRKERKKKDEDAQEEIVSERMNPIEMLMPNMAALTDSDNSFSLDDIPDTLDVDLIHRHCQTNGLSFMDTDTGFIAYDDSFAFIVTVMSVDEFKTLDEVLRMIAGSNAGIFTQDWEKDKNSMRYENYLDPDNPGYGYTYFGLILSKDTVLIIQGIGVKPTDDVITRAKDFHKQMEALFGI